MTRAKSGMTRRDAIGLTGAAIAMSGTASAQAYKAPGVYIEEIPIVPPSIAQVETAVPLFIGFTKNAVAGRVEINSFADFRREFGETASQTYEFASLSLTDSKSFTSARTPPSVNRTKSASPVSFDLRPAGPAFYLEEAIRLFFQNGGDKCLVQSAGLANSAASASALSTAVQSLQSINDPDFTLLAIPDAMMFSASEVFAIQQSALFFCDSVRTVFAILDVPGTHSRAAPDPAEAFRNGIGSIGLDRAAAYAPWIELNQRYDPSRALLLLSHEALTRLCEFIEARIEDLEIVGSPTDIKRVLPAAVKLRTAGPDSPEFLESVAFLRRALPFVGDISAKLAQIKLVVPPSGAMAGVYARVDRDRGVWKAPANVSLNGISGLAYEISQAEQETLNSPPGGRAINPIRSFTGRGIQVWGARTLSSDPEYKYVSVRRFSIMVEDSLNKGLGWVVFEPNAEPLWANVRASVDNFLSSLWREGALQGSKAEHAYFVRCGLGETMTQNDLDVGRMIVEIGMAVTRPAEFLIQRFTFNIPP